MNEITPIEQWQAFVREHFTAHTDAALMTKLEEEVREFGNALYFGETTHQLNEAADIIIVLAGWAGRHHLDLMAAVEQKIAINLNRTWEQMPDGTYKHAEENTDGA